MGLSDYNQARHVHDQRNSLLSKGRRGTLPGTYAMAIELADTVVVMLSGRAPIALPAGRYL
jgi:hypothetical protein